jgi:hypothetical protein
MNIPYFNHTIKISHLFNIFNRTYSFFIIFKKKNESTIRINKDKGVSAGTQHLGTCLAPARHLVGTFDAFQYGHLRHLQPLQPLFHYLKCFSQHLVVKIKRQSLETKFYRKVLRKALKIMEKRLQVLKVPIVKCAEVPSRC